MMNYFIHCEEFGFGFGIQRNTTPPPFLDPGTQHTNRGLSCSNCVSRLKMTIYKLDQLQILTFLDQDIER